VRSLKSMIERERQNRKHLFLKQVIAQLSDAFKDPFLFPKHKQEQELQYLHSLQRVLIIKTFYEKGIDSKILYKASIAALESNKISLHLDFAFSTYSEFTKVLKKMIQTLENEGDQ
jgi:hypothetical protein